MITIIVAKNKADAYDYGRANGLKPIYVWWKPTLKEAQKMADYWSRRADVEVINILAK